MRRLIGKGLAQQGPEAPSHIRTLLLCQLITAAQALQLIGSFNDPSDAAAAKSRDLTLLLLQLTPAPFSRRQFTPGHVTATGLVLAPDGERLLLVHHARLDRWLLPGGHVEPEDPELWMAACREVLEETGVELYAGAAPLVGIDVHGIPPRKSEPFHLHHDLVFAFQAQSTEARVSHESRAVAWARPAEFERYDIPFNTRLAYWRVRAR